MLTLASLSFSAAVSAAAPVNMVHIAPADMCNMFFDASGDMHSDEDPLVKALEEIFRKRQMEVIIMVTPFGPSPATKEARQQSAAESAVKSALMGRP